MRHAVQNPALPIFAHGAPGIPGGREIQARFAANADGLSSARCPKLRLLIGGRLIPPIRVVITAFNRFSHEANTSHLYGMMPFSMYFVIPVTLKIDFPDIL